MDVDQLQELLWSFASHRVITVAARTGLLERLAANAETAGAAAAALGLDALAVGKLVRALCALGVVEPDGEGYRITPGLRGALQPGAASLIPFIAHSHALYDRWGEGLEGWVRSGEWTTAPRTPAGQQAFGAAMQAMGTHVARQLARQLEVGDARRMLDLGGGFGHYARALLRVAPSLHAVVLDVPGTVELARAELAAGPDAALAPRLAFVAGDYLESALDGPYDLVLEANILHQEDARGAERLVQRGAAALAPGGRLAVVDFSIDDAQRGQALGALFAINMRSRGDTYPEPTIRSWMERAGLTEVRRTDLSSFRWLIVGRRPR